MLMTSQPITAFESYRLGMVNEFCPPGELMAGPTAV
jgi:enoyl-CoA hydratase/carnithine racemase